jgi:hypothetical protein
LLDGRPGFDSHPVLSWRKLISLSRRLPTYGDKRQSGDEERGVILDCAVTISSSQWGVTSIKNKKKRKNCGGLGQQIVVFLKEKT